MNASDALKRSKKGKQNKIEVNLDEVMRHILWAALDSAVEVHEEVYAENLPTLREAKYEVTLAEEVVRGHCEPHYYRISWDHVEEPRDHPASRPNEMQVDNQAEAYALKEMVREDMDHQYKLLKEYVDFTEDQIVRTFERQLEESCRETQSRAFSEACSFYEARRIPWTAIFFLTACAIWGLMYFGGR